MTARDEGSRRSLGAWGFEGEGYPPTPELLGWLEERLGSGEPLPRCRPSRIPVPAPGRLPDLGVPLATGPSERLARARGQGLPDLIRWRAGAPGTLPDGVARPDSTAAVERVLRRCAASGVRVVPRGGGTSVTGGVNIPPGEPAISLDLERLAGLEEIDPASRLATFGAGTAGPLLERELAAHDLTLGHFPQSWELSTLGGWIATRASGQESLGYGGISDLVAGLELAAPAGRLALAALPASAAGPDLRQLVLGSEGRLGVVTRATVRVSPRPPVREVEASLLPSWSEGLEACRRLVQERTPLTLLRLSDPPETEVALAVGLAARPGLAPLLRGWLRLRGLREAPCLLLAGAAGGAAAVRSALARSRSRLRPHGPVVRLGRSPGRRWLAERFRHPYLRDALLDRGIATDTLETAAPWSRLEALGDAVRGALDGALAGSGERSAVLCHLSHPYADGASLYFTFFFRCPADPDHALDRWATLKRAATDALVAAGGTLSHHHGVGSWHAPWLEREIGGAGRALLTAAAEALDPAGILNPHVLLDPADRLRE